jgi:hypothetical protein
MHHQRLRKAILAMCLGILILMCLVADDTGIWAAPVPAVKCDYECRQRQLYRYKPDGSCMYQEFSDCFLCARVSGSDNYCRITAEKFLPKCGEDDMQPQRKKPWTGCKALCTFATAWSDAQDGTEAGDWEPFGNRYLCK